MQVRTVCPQQGMMQEPKVEIADPDMCIQFPETVERRMGIGSDEGHTAQDYATCGLFMLMK